jgi:hypothetical protein
MRVSRKAPVLSESETVSVKENKRFSADASEKLGGRDRGRAANEHPRAFIPATYVANVDTLARKPNPLLALDRLDDKHYGIAEKDGFSISLTFFHALEPPHGLYSVEMLSLLLDGFEQLDMAQKANVAGRMIEAAGGMASFMRLMQMRKEEMAQNAKGSQKGAADFEDFVPIADGII